MEPLALDLSRVIRLTDDEFFALCAANKGLHIERNANGELEIMALAGGETSNRNTHLIAALWSWNEVHGEGLVFGSDGGFRLPNGAMRAPDAAWLARDRWEALAQEERTKFPPRCPDFVIELRSPSDRLQTLQQKMDEWIDNGCRLGWLIDPVDEQASVYRPEGDPAGVGFDATLGGEEVLPGFSLDLSRLR